MSEPTKTPQYPDRYIVHQHTQRCVCCGTTSRWSEVFAHFTVTGFNGKPNGNTLQRLRWPSPLYNLPIERTLVREEMVPFCHDCQNPSLNNFWPSVPSHRPQVVVSVANAPAKPAKPEPVKPAKLTLAQLGDLI